MWTTVLLVVTYLAFISLGLPDTVIGVTLPALQDEFGTPLSFGGVLTMIVVGGTVISSFAADRVIRAFDWSGCFSELFDDRFSLAWFFDRSVVLLAVSLGLAAGAWWRDD